MRLPVAMAGVDCEKPITVTPDEFSELCEIADGNKLIYIEAIMYMHSPVRAGVDFTYPVLFCEFFSALARTRIYGEEFKIGRELQPVDKAFDYPARADDG